MMRSFLFVLLLVGALASASGFGQTLRPTPSAGVSRDQAAAASAPAPSVSPTPVMLSPQTVEELKQLQRSALASDYAYAQVAHLSNNIGPRFSGSAQAAK